MIDMNADKMEIITVMSRLLRSWSGANDVTLRAGPNISVYVMRDHCSFSMNFTCESGVLSVQISNPFEQFYECIACNANEIPEKFKYCVDSIGVKIRRRFWYAENILKYANFNLIKPTINPPEVTAAERSPLLSNPIIANPLVESPDIISKGVER